MNDVYGVRCGVRRGVSSREDLGNGLVLEGFYDVDALRLVGPDGAARWFRSDGWMSARRRALLVARPWLSRSA